MKKLTTILIVLLTTLGLFSQTYVWTGAVPNDDNWSTAGNWDQGQVPPIGANVEIGVGSSVVVDINATVESFNVNKANITIPASVTLNVTKSAIILGDSNNPELYEIAGEGKFNYSETNVIALVGEWLKLSFYKIGVEFSAEGYINKLTGNTFNNLCNITHFNNSNTQTYISDLGNVFNGVTTLAYKGGNNNYSRYFNDVFNSELILKIIATQGNHMRLELTNCTFNENVSIESLLGSPVNSYISIEGGVLADGRQFKAMSTGFRDKLIIDGLSVGNSIPFEFQNIENFLDLSEVEIKNMNINTGFNIVDYVGDLTLDNISVSGSVEINAEGLVSLKNSSIIGFADVDAIGTITFNNTTVSDVVTINGQGSVWITENSTFGNEVSVVSGSYTYVYESSFNGSGNVSIVGTNIGSNKNIIIRGSNFHGDLDVEYNGIVFKSGSTFYEEATFLRPEYSFGNAASTGGNIYKKDVAFIDYSSGNNTGGLQWRICENNHDVYYGDVYVKNYNNGYGVFMGPLTLENGGSLDFKGNVYVHNPNGKAVYFRNITFNGTNGIQTITGGQALNVTNIEINNPSGLEIGTDVIDINGNSNLSEISRHTNLVLARGYMKFTDGKVFLRSKLTLGRYIHRQQGSYHTILGHSYPYFEDYTSGKYVVICNDGDDNNQIADGEIFHQYYSSSDIDTDDFYNAYLYPIGDNGEFSPIVISYDNEPNFTWSTRGVEIKLRGVKEPHLECEQSYINRHWSIEPIGIDGFGANVEFHFPESDLNSSGSLSDLKPIKYTQENGLELIGDDTFINGSTGLGLSNYQTINLIGLTSFGTYTADKSIEPNVTADFTHGMSDCTNHLHQFTSTGFGVMHPNCVHSWDFTEDQVVNSNEVHPYYEYDTEATYNVSHKVENTCNSETVVQAYNINLYHDNLTSTEVTNGTFTFSGVSQYNGIGLCSGEALYLL
jgi:hypothetical protein